MNVLKLETAQTVQANSRTHVVVSQQEQQTKKVDLVLELCDYHIQKPNRAKRDEYTHEVSF